MLKQQIQGDVSSAVKAGDEIAVSTLRMLSAAILSKEKEKRYKLSKSGADLKEAELIEKSALTEEETLEAVSFEVKKRKEAILGFEQGNRPELAAKEKKEMEILMKYMPEQISPEELKKIIEEAIEKTGAKEIKDMGKIMAEVMPKIKGRADGGDVSKISKEILQK